MPSMEVRLLQDALIDGILTTQELPFCFARAESHRENACGDRWRAAVFGLRGDTPRAVKGRGHAVDSVSSQPSARRCALFVQAGAPQFDSP